MQKHEVAEMLGLSDDAPVLGPIEDHLHDLATERELPVLAIGACLLRIEEVGPPLRAVLARAAAGETLSADEDRLFFRGLHILGGGTRRRASRCCACSAASPTTSRRCSAT
jgi:hypothetical protein